MFAFGFYTVGHVGCYAGGLSELHDKYVTDMWKSIMCPLAVTVSR